jgi:hypothetical protein
MYDPFYWAITDDSGDNLVQQPTVKSGGGPEEQFFSTTVVQDGQLIFWNMASARRLAPPASRDAPIYMRPARISSTM